MVLEFDNTFTRNLNSSFSANIKNNKTIYEHFCDFYKLQTNSELDCEKQNQINNILKEELF